MVSVLSLSAVAHVLKITRNVLHVVLTLKASQNWAHSSRDATLTLIGVRSMDWAVLAWTMIKITRARSGVVQMSDANSDEAYLAKRNIFHLKPRSEFRESLPPWAQAVGGRVREASWSWTVHPINADSRCVSFVSTSRVSPVCVALVAWLDCAGT